MERKDLEIIKLKSDIFTGKIKEYITLLFFFGEIIVFTFIGLYYSGVEVNIFNKPVETKVAVLHINKPITDRLSDEVYKAVEKVRADASFKELVIKMNSPGGSPSASQEIAEYLKSVNKELPVTMYIDEIAASGGYYIASAIKPIIANKNAIIGSIGVVMPHYDASKLAETLGIKENTLTAGEFKQPFSLLKKMTKTNESYIKNNLLLPAYANFLDDVAENRGMKKESLLAYAEGKVFIAGDDKVQNILIDKISNFFKVKEDLKRKYGDDLIFVTINKKITSNRFFTIFADPIIEMLKSEFRVKLH